jgi:starch-binding outer membrane protein, SusD/RagB family
VIDHASKALPAGNPAGSLRQWNSTYIKLTGEEQAALYGNSSEKANFLLAGANSRWARRVSYKYGLNAAITDSVYNKVNATGTTFAYYVGQGDEGGETRGINKFRENFIEAGQGIGYPYIYIPLFSAEEALFNRAEANVMLGNFDVAFSDLNAFVSTRVRIYHATTQNLTPDKVKAFYKTTDLKAALLNTILDFKRMEFMEEGLRWLDILRYRLPVTHRTEKGAVITVTADDPRKVLQIPQFAQRAGIAPNPR